MIRMLKTFLLLAPLHALACSDQDQPPTLPDPSSGEVGAPTDPTKLRVEFEELALNGEPSFVTDFAFYPGSDRDFLALDKSGKVMRYRLGEPSAELVSSAQLDGVYDKLDCGAISLAFEPDFAEGSYLYVGTCTSLSDSAVLRVELDDDLNVLEGSEVTVIRVGSPLANRPWHNIGSIGFEPGGVMWAIFGDKVQGGPAQDRAQSLGKLLRFVPSRAPGTGGFEPAPDGPLVDDAGADPSVYALGLRSPFRGARDSRGFYWIGDVGSDFFEEVNVVHRPLQNFGWPELEGPCDDCGETTSPAFYWARGASPDYIADDPEVETTIARVAWAGPEVIASEHERYHGLLAGSVLFGDYCAGFVRHGRVDDDGIPTLDAPLGHLNNAGAFRQHTDGYVYAMTFGRCQTDVDNRADEGQSRPLSNGDAGLSRPRRLVPSEGRGGSPPGKTRSNARSTGERLGKGPLHSIAHARAPDDTARQAEKYGASTRLPPLSFLFERPQATFPRPSRVELVPVRI